MDNKELLRHLYLELSPSDRKKFLSNLPDDVKPDQSKIDADTFDELMRKERFPEGICCPHCGNVKVGTHGSYKGNPRYICYGCKKTFNLTSRSVFNGHKQSLETYTKYIKLMTMGTSIRKAAQICGISVTTSFLWRHKFLDVLQQIADKTKVGGIVEADETYVKLSFKGSRVLPRLPHKRGNDLDKKFLDSDGIPTPKVCVPCAVDRNDHTQTTGAIARATNLEKPMTKHLSALFENRIVPDSILCTDKLAHYVKVAEQFDLNLIQFKANRKDQSIIRSSVGNFHINNVNNYHSRIKNFLTPFKGVATKYLNNYLNWFNFVNQLKSKNVEETLVNLFASQISDEVSKEVQKKPPIPFKTPYDKFFTVQGIYCGKEKVPNSRSDKPVYRPVVKFGKRVSLDAPELEKFKFKTKTKKTNKKDK